MSSMTEDYKPVGLPLRLHESDGLSQVYFPNANRINGEVSDSNNNRKPMINGNVDCSLESTFNVFQDNAMSQSTVPGTTIVGVVNSCNNAFYVDPALIGSTAVIGSSDINYSTSSDSRNFDEIVNCCASGNVRNIEDSYLYSPSLNNFTNFSTPSNYEPVDDAGLTATLGKRRRGAGGALRGGRASLGRRKPQRKSISNLNEQPFELKDSEEYGDHFSNSGGPIVTSSRLGAGVGPSYIRKKAYGCDACPALFGSKMELEEHQNSHTGQKPFECDICYARFNRRSTLWNHKRIHSNYKPFTCPVCLMTFKWKNSLKCHTEMHSRKQESEDGSGDGEDLGSPLGALVAEGLEASNDGMHSLHGSGVMGIPAQRRIMQNEGGESVDSLPESALTNGGGSPSDPPFTAGSGRKSKSSRRKNAANPRTPKRAELGDCLEVAHRPLRGIGSRGGKIRKKRGISNQNIGKNGGQFGGNNMSMMNDFCGDGDGNTYHANSQRGVSLCSANDGYGYEGTHATSLMPTEYTINGGVMADNSYSVSANAANFGNGSMLPPNCIADHPPSMHQLGSLGNTGMPPNGVANSNIVQYFPASEYDSTSSFSADQSATLCAGESGPGYSNVHLNVSNSMAYTNDSFNAGTDGAVNSLSAYGYNSASSANSPSVRFPPAQFNSPTALDSCPSSFPAKQLHPASLYPTNGVFQCLDNSPPESSPGVVGPHGTPSSPNQPIPSGGETGFGERRGALSVSQVIITSTGSLCGDDKKAVVAGTGGGVAFLANCAQGSHEGGSQAALLNNTSLLDLLSAGTDKNKALILTNDSCNPEPTKLGYTFACNDSASTVVISEPSMNGFNCSQDTKNFNPPNSTSMVVNRSLHSRMQIPNHLPAESGSAVVQQQSVPSPHLPSGQVISSSRPPSTNRASIKLTNSIKTDAKAGLVPDYASQPSILYDDSGIGCPVEYPGAGNAGLLMSSGTLYPNDNDLLSCGFQPAVEQQLLTIGSGGEIYGEADAHQMYCSQQSRAGMQMQLLPALPGGNVAQFGAVGAVTNRESVGCAGPIAMENGYMIRELAFSEY